MKLECIQCRKKVLQENWKFGGTAPILLAPVKGWFTPHKVPWIPNKYLNVSEK